MMRVTAPSKIGHWDGVIPPGDRFTRNQRVSAVRFGYDIDSFETMTVMRRGTAREFWIPIGGEYPMVEASCAIIERRPGNRVFVLTPGGFRIVVNADGSLLTDPSRKKRKP
ncbi:hypothetical protein [Sphingomonas sanxanigenens]|uniref:Uncharacterized protein n=1 Tax=Sphingomonas sanxanigenens DSM 19645 = NX02 TaxID=1123269 RepID=W0A6B5_9SPHN|nr:hypothetical protein [Sphingomonas sanxanigenens]AHE52601.1 hypothetical protein NX02_04265 [Sphingomonas sanxanigenens DSM 19645 = NX02]AHE56042.1 hypothetical protein NX02_22080 [Sphingomonas sanxanigenens DSM 19645 = NX02]